MRLDKYLSSVTDLSRSQAKRVIRAGRVKVLDNLMTDPRSEVAIDDMVFFDGRLLRNAEPRYFMLHKPKGYVSSTKDSQHLTVIDLIDEDNIEQLHIAGRLDLDTTGLLLITDDGRWSHRITSPSHDCKKTYLVETSEPITSDMVIKIEQGIQLKNEKKKTLPADLTLLDEHTARLQISEGKYHQIKRLFAAVGNKVDALHRESVGNIILDKYLAPGEYRRLCSDEVSSI